MNGVGPIVHVCSAVPEAACVRGRRPGSIKVDIGSGEIKHEILFMHLLGEQRRDIARRFRNPSDIFPLATAALMRFRDAGA